MASDSQFHYVKAGRVHFFCPLCHYHQSTNTIRRVSWRNIGQLFLLSSTSTLLLWPLFGAKGLFFFFPYWAAFEAVYRMRKRQALVCQSCGFDPFLYKQDIKKARAALKQHWEKKIQAENLFAGIKLKNYQTNPLNQPGAAVHPENVDDGKSEGASPPSLGSP